MMIILCGLPGSGKSRVGSLLAEALELPFYDTDQLIEQRFQRTCRELYREMGESGFRSIESEVIRELAGAGVVATGGGSLLIEQNAQRLTRLGKIVYLKVELEKLLRRLNDPAYLGGLTFEELAERRRPYYERWSHITIEIADETPDEIVAWIQKELYG